MSRFDKQHIRFSRRKTKLSSRSFMGLLSRLFGNTGEFPESFPIAYDMHSHLLPAIDDGVQSLTEAVDLALALERIGYRKLIITPHIMGDYYKNSAANIFPLKEQLQEALLKQSSELEIEAAAEHLLDEWFPEMLKQETVLPFEGKYLLVETPFLNQPSAFQEMMFEIQMKGYTPVLAHPERYAYVTDTETYEEWVDRGILLQLNLTSLSGVHSPQVLKNARHLIRKGIVHFAGTDLHNEQHLDMLKKAVQTKYFRELMALNLINKL